MNDFTSLLEKLRSEHNDPWQVNPAAKIAADAIEAQAKRIAELEAALKPFADMTATIVDGMVAHSFTMDDIRTARKVLGEKE